MKRPSPGGASFEHAVGLYSDEDEFVAMVAAFVEQSLDAGEPVVVAAGHQAALRARLPDHPDVEFARGLTYRRPAGAVATWLDRFRTHGATRGGRRLRIIGELDSADISSPLAWEPWARYEAAVNTLFAEFDVSSLCMYDRGITPEYVLADLMRTHPRMATPESRSARNDDYQPPRLFLAGRAAPPTDPLQHHPPVVELFGAAPAEARRAVRRAAAASSLSAEDIDHLVFAVSEAVANAHAHGRPPVVVRVWTAPDRAIAAVRDAGPGPADPFAGLTHADDDGTRGRGLWIAHQVCDHVVHVHDPSGFQLRATVGSKLEAPRGLN